MALTLQESFNNVRVICHNALMKREEWLAIDESLNNIAGALQAHDVMLQAAKDKEPENLENESDGCKD
jgi:hypothetical protein